jgi:hypothetical protein
MLVLGSTTFTVDGVTIFKDHADPNQFWYLPAPVALARRAVDGQANFTFIKYKPKAVEAGKGGGFLMFTTELKLTPGSALESKIIGEITTKTGVTQPRLAAVPFDSGTVQCVALDVQGAGGTSNPLPAGAFRAVEKILGASVPSLAGDNNALFSLALSQEGATIIDQAFAQGAQPVGVIYDLKYTALRPALKVKITADFKRVYNQFKASLEGQYYFVKASLEAQFEWLKQTGAIKIEVINFSDAADREDKEKWALEFFRDKLMTDWFTPTLVPGEARGGSAPAAGGTGGGGAPTASSIGSAIGSAIGGAVGGAGGAAAGWGRWWRGGVRRRWSGEWRRFGIGPAERLRRFGFDLGHHDGLGRHDATSKRRCGCDTKRDGRFDHQNDQASDRDIQHHAARSRPDSGRAGHRLHAIDLWQHRNADDSRCEPHRRGGWHTRECGPHGPDHG